MQEFELREKTTGESLTKKLRMLFYSLEEVPEVWEECETELEKQLYLIKNMDKMDKNSTPYLNGGYEEIFEAAESARLAGEEVVLYSQSISRLQSIEAGLEFRFEEGKAEGREEGRNEEKKVIAKNLKRLGIPVSAITDSTGLTPEEIDSL